MVWTACILSFVPLYKRTNFMRHEIQQRKPLQLKASKKIILISPEDSIRMSLNLWNYSTVYQQSQPLSNARCFTVKQSIFNIETSSTHVIESPVPILYHSPLCVWYCIDYAFIMTDCSYKALFTAKEHICYLVVKHHIYHTEGWESLKIPVC